MGYIWKLRLLAALAGLALPMVASAQLDEGRAGREGPGFKVGRLVLHPGFSAEGGYDSNVFLQQKGAEEDSFILRLTGYLDVSTEPPIRQREGDASGADAQKIQFRGGLGARYYHYFNNRVPESVAGDAHVDFKYNPSQSFTLQVTDEFVRTVRPFTNPTTFEGETSSYGLNTNLGSLNLIGRSKSRVLEGKVGYTNLFRFYDADVFQFYNFLTHQVPAQLSWSFFPTSALVYMADYSRRTYGDQTGTDATVLLADSHRISNLIGYNGAITERFSLTVMIGYAAGFFDVGSDFDGVVARVEAQWKPRPTISLTAGYVRDLQASLIGNFTEINMLRAQTDFVLAGALRLGLKAWVSFNKSGLALAQDGTLLGNAPFRKDTRVLASIFGEYLFTAWLSLIARVGYLADFTDFQFLGTPPAPEPLAQYQRFDAWIGIRIFY